VDTGEAGSDCFFAFCSLIRLERRGCFVAISSCSCSSDVVPLRRVKATFGCGTLRLSSCSEEAMTAASLESFASTIDSKLSMFVLIPYTYIKLKVPFG